MNDLKRMTKLVAVGLAAVLLCSCAIEPTEQHKISTPSALGTWTIVAPIKNPHLEKNEQFEIFEDDGEMFLVFKAKKTATTPDFDGVSGRSKLQRIENGPIETWCAPAVMLANGREHVFIFDVLDDGNRLVVHEAHTTKRGCEDRWIHGGRAHAEN